MNERLTKTILTRLVWVYMFYKIASKLIVWCKQVGVLKPQRHIDPVVSALPTTPWSNLLGSAKNYYRQDDLRVKLVKLYASGMTGKVKSLKGCRMLFSSAPIVLTTNELILKRVLNTTFNTTSTLDFGCQLVFGKPMLTILQDSSAIDHGVFYKEQRKKSSKLFTEKNLNGLVRASLQYRTCKLVERLQEHIDSKVEGEFPMLNEIHTLPFDVFAQIGFAYDFETEEEELEYEEALDELVELLPTHYREPSLMLPLSDLYLPTKVRIARARDMLWSLASKIIGEKLGRNVAGKSLSLLIVDSARKAQHSNNGLSHFVVLFLSPGRMNLGDIMHLITYFLLMHLSISQLYFEKIVHFISSTSSSKWLGPQIRLNLKLAILFVLCYCIPLDIVIIVYCIRWFVYFRYELTRLN